MTTYNFDAFGNPVQTTATGQPRSGVLYSDGVYDPALALSRFTSPDIHAGEAALPASL